MAAVAEGFRSHDPALATLLECDRALVSIGRRIKVLKAIDWPVELEERFLAAWRRGQPELPAPPTQPQVLADEMAALEALMAADRSRPSDRKLAVQDGVELPRGRADAGRHRHARVHPLLDPAVRPSRLRGIAART